MTSLGTYVTLLCTKGTPLRIRMNETDTKLDGNEERLMELGKKHQCDLTIGPHADGQWNVPKES